MSKQLEVEDCKKCPFQSHWEHKFWPKCNLDNNLDLMIPPLPPAGCPLKSGEFTVRLK